MKQAQLPIAFFDSGLGGISVLRQAVRQLPGEDYLYFGDCLHAPYGTKHADEVLALTLAAVEPMIEAGIKALVIACNTATAIAVTELRRSYPALPVFGTEPAIKPAAEAFPGGRILMLATPMTVREEKFRRLWEKYTDQAEIIPIGCEGLMEFVEQGIFEGEAVEGYLREKLAPYLQAPVDAVVLGCTHYPFLTSAIRRIVGDRPQIMDGSAGIAAHLRHVLEEKCLRNPQAAGKVTFHFSGESPKYHALAEQLLRQVII